MTINIPVSPDYKLTSDERNIIVKERYFSDPTKAPNWAKPSGRRPNAAGKVVRGSVSLDGRGYSVG